MVNHLPPPSVGPHHPSHLVQSDSSQPESDDLTEEQSTKSLSNLSVKDPNIKAAIAGILSLGTPSHKVLPSRMLKEADEKDRPTEQDYLAAGVNSDGFYVPSMNHSREIWEKIRKVNVKMIYNIPHAWVRCSSGRNLLLKCTPLPKNECKELGYVYKGWNKHRTPFKSIRLKNVTASSTTSTSSVSQPHDQLLSRVEAATLAASSTTSTTTVSQPHNQLLARVEAAAVAASSSISTFISYDQSLARVQAATIAPRSTTSISSGSQLLTRVETATATAIAAALASAENSSSLPTTREENQPTKNDKTENENVYQNTTDDIKMAHAAIAFNSQTPPLSVPDGLPIDDDSLIVTAKVKRTAPSRHFIEANKKDQPTPEDCVAAGINRNRTYDQSMNNEILIWKNIQRSNVKTINDIPHAWVRSKCYSKSKLSSKLRLKCLPLSKKKINELGYEYKVCNEYLSPYKAICLTLIQATTSTSANTSTSSQATPPLLSDTAATASVEATAASVAEAATMAIEGSADAPLPKKRKHQRTSYETDEQPNKKFRSNDENHSEINTSPSYPDALSNNSTTTSSSTSSASTSISSSSQHLSTAVPAVPSTTSTLK